MEVMIREAAVGCAVRRERVGWWGEERVEEVSGGAGGVARRAMRAARRRGAMRKARAEAAVRRVSSVGEKALLCSCELLREV